MRKEHIRDKYHQEISDIDYYLNRLEEGRFYKYNGNVSQNDGSLPKIIDHIRHGLNDLLNKIESDYQSESDTLQDELKKYRDENHTND
jgi:RNA polymerase-binding transcription factor DksA